MKIYRWRSEALKQYGNGYILALGRDVDDARKHAREHFEKVSRARWEWLFEKYPDWTLDEDDKEERRHKLSLLESDIQAEPEISDAFFIDGSE